MCKAETIERLSVCTTESDGKCQNFLSKFRKTTLMSVTSRVTSAQRYRAVCMDHRMFQMLFLGAFAKLRKKTDYYCRQVCLSFLLSHLVEKLAGFRNI